MQDLMQARDRCEAHIYAAIDALVIALGIGAAPTTDSTARRAAELARAAHAIAAAQAANDGADPDAPAGDGERAQRRMGEG